MTRTNIVLDEKAVEKGLKLTGLTTRRALIDYALRELLRHGSQARILTLKGRVRWEGNLAKSRLGRPSR